MKVHQVAEGLLRIALMPPDHTNVYLAGEVLIDAGGRFDAKRIISTLENHPISAHALTHAHFDHYGGSLGICEALGVPVWCGAGDEETVSTGDMSLVLPNPHNLLGKLVRGMSRPGVPVGRVLREGDLVGGFTVIETPGHTPGHLAFWRGYDGVLILGDVAFNRNPLTLRSGITEPFRLATWNSALNRESARKLAALGPKIVCFGHGAHLTDGARFSEFAENLPSPVSIRGDRE